MPKLGKIFSFWSSMPHRCDVTPCGANETLKSPPVGNKVVWHEQFGVWTSPPRRWNPGYAADSWGFLPCLQTGLAVSFVEVSCNRFTASWWQCVHSALVTGDILGLFYCATTLQSTVLWHLCVSVRLSVCHADIDFFTVYMVGWTERLQQLTYFFNHW